METLKMKRSYAIFAAAAFAAIACVSHPAAGQGKDFPTKGLRIVVPFAPGGGNDILARVIAPRLSEILGQPVIVDNRPGAGGNIGTEMVARAGPDGYTILMASNQVTINPAAGVKLAFELERDFAPVGMVASVPIILVANPQQPYKTLQEFIAYVKAHPRTVNYSSPGTGTPQHLAGELFARLTKTDLTHVPYKGTGPAISDVVGGQVQISFATLASVQSFIQNGRLKAIGIAGDQRAASLPELPTFVEAGLRGYEAALWYSLLVPAATPRPAIARLNAALEQALSTVAVRERLVAQGFDPQTSTPEQLAQRIKQDLARWDRVVRESGIKLEQ
jgi:tripartite-type tricarboxylate transporter receptor subunit TctC